MYFIKSFMHNTIVSKKFSAIADKKNKMEKIQMETKAMIKGMAAGAVVGTACYMISKSPDRKKKQPKRNTGKAVKAFASVADCFSSMF